MTVILGGVIASLTGGVNGIAKIPFWIYFIMLIVFRTLFATNTLSFIFPLITTTTAANTYYSYLVYYEVLNVIFYALGYLFMRFSLKNAAGILEYWNSIGSVCAGIALWIGLHTTLVLYAISGFWLGIVWAILGVLGCLTVYYLVMKYMINSNHSLIKINRDNTKEYQSLKPLVLTVYDYIYKDSMRCLAVCIGMAMFVWIIFLGQFFQYLWVMIPMSQEATELWSAFSTILPIVMFMIVVWYFYSVRIDSTTIGCVSDDDEDDGCTQECSTVDLNEYKRVEESDKSDSSDSDCSSKNSDSEKKTSKKNKKEKKVVQSNTAVCVEVV